MVDLIVLACVVFAFGIVSRRLEGTVLTAPIVFVLAGGLLDPAGLGLVEMGLNDGLSVPFLVLFLILAKSEEGRLPERAWVRFALEQVGLGVLVGVGIGLAEQASTRPSSASILARGGR
jgi:NhaP-type Na+/H+ and K+/H+ antiporter